MVGAKSIILIDRRHGMQSGSIRTCHGLYRSILFAHCLSIELVVDLLSVYGEARAMHGAHRRNAIGGLV